jgi:ribonuclease Z
MSEIKPRHAVAYHFFNEEGTRYGIYDGVRSTYDGPLSLATDNMVWNISKDKITERMAVSPEDAWSVPGATSPPQPPAAGTVPDPMTDWIKGGRRQPAIDTQGNLLKTFKKEHNMK